MHIPQYRDNNGRMRHGKATPHVVNGVRMQTGNSRNTNKKSLAPILQEINDRVPWDESNPELFHRDANKSIQTLITKLIEADMMEGYSDYHYSTIKIKHATVEIAKEWNIPVGAPYDVNPFTLWTAGHG